MYRKFLLLFICITGNSHSLLSQLKITDSLHNLLVSHGKVDTVRVDLLNDLAYELRRNNPGATDSLIRIAIDVAGKLNYKKGKGFALAIQGSRFYAQVKYKSADSVFAISKQLLETGKDYRNMAFLLRSMANMEMDEGDYAASLDNFLRINQGAKIRRYKTSCRNSAVHWIPL